MYKIALLVAAAFAGASASFGGVQVGDVVQACQIFFSNPEYYKNQGVNAIGAGVCANLVNMNAIVIPDNVKATVIQLYPSLAPAGSHPSTAEDNATTNQSVSGGDLVQAATDFYDAFVELEAASEAATEGGAFEGNSVSSFKGSASATSLDGHFLTGAAQGVELANEVNDNASAAGLNAAQIVKDADENGEVTLDAGVSSSSTNNQNDQTSVGTLSFAGTSKGANAKQSVKARSGAITGKKNDSSE